jgi:hypothetical protein
MRFWSRLNIFQARTSDRPAYAGSTIIEVIVGIAIVAVAIVGMTMLFIAGFDAYKISRGYTFGIYLAQEKMEEIPAANSPSATIPGKPTVSIPAISNMGTEVLQDITYRWERKYFEQDSIPAGGQTSTPPRLVQVEVLVKWSDAHGDHKVSLVTLKQK